jgi:hypothetical protein
MQFCADSIRNQHLVLNPDKNTCENIIFVKIIELHNFDVQT